VDETTGVTIEEAAAPEALETEIQESENEGEINEEAAAPEAGAEAGQDAKSEAKGDLKSGAKGEAKSKSKEDGLLQAVTAERKMRQFAEGQLNRLNAELAAIKNQLQEKEKVEFAPDEIPTFAQLDKLLDRKLQAQSKGVDENAIRAYLSEEAVKQAVPDWEDVVSEYLPEMLKSKPYLDTVIYNSANPAMTAYELACGNSRYIEKLKKEIAISQTKKIAKKISGQKNAPLSGTGTAGKVGRDFSKMSDIEFANYRASVKGEI
jgi:hypothetical protein